MRGVWYNTIDNMADKLIKKHDELVKSFLTNRSSAKQFVQLYLNPLVLKKCELGSLIIEGNIYPLSFNPGLCRTEINNSLHIRICRVIIYFSPSRPESKYFGYRTVSPTFKYEQYIPIVFQSWTHNTQASRFPIRVPMKTSADIARDCHALHSKARND